MHVRVNQTGHQRDIAKVNYFRAYGTRHRRADFNDALSLNENFAGRDHASGFDIEQARGVKHEVAARCARGLSGRVCANGES
jgi:hypothetical protein